MILFTAKRVGGLSQLFDTNPKISKKEKQMSEGIPTYVVSVETIETNGLSSGNFGEAITIDGTEYRPIQSRRLNRMLDDYYSKAMIGTRWIGEGKTYLEIQFSTQNERGHLVDKCNVSASPRSPLCAIEVDDSVDFGSDDLNEAFRHFTTSTFGISNRDVLVTMAIDDIATMSSDKVVILLQPLLPDLEKECPTSQASFLGIDFSSEQARKFAQLQFDVPGNGHPSVSSEVTISQSYKGITWLTFNFIDFLQSFAEDRYEKGSAIIELMTLLDKAVAYEQQPTLEIDNLAEQIQEAARTRKREALSRFIRARQKRYDEETENVTVEVKELEKKLVDARRRRGELLLIKRALGGAWAAAEETVVEELDLILALPDVESVTLTVQTQVVVVTHCLSFSLVDDDDSHYKLGRCKLVIDFDGRAVEVTNFDHRPDGCDHPHVNGGQICYGNIQGEINEYLINWEILNAVSALIDFLRTCNPDDEYVEHSEWEKIPKPIIYEEDEHEA